MKRTQRERAGWALVAAIGLACTLPAWADMELTAPDGRRVLLKDDGSWRYVDAPAAAVPGSEAPEGSATAAPAAPPARADLLLERREEVPAGCRFEFGLINTLGYEIRMLVPEFTVYRRRDAKDAGQAEDGVGVAYASRTIDFGPLRPGDRNRRGVVFGGIRCAEIAALRVGAADRCVMGDLTKFSDVKGECLARLQLQPSELLPFEKER
ncbi:MAG: hypothetical protein HYZ20_02760 [Burkholderiales bacterium]|nr:hypothetical protein [Burkholderiales bacterium]